MDLADQEGGDPVAEDANFSPIGRDFFLIKKQSGATVNSSVRLAVVMRWDQPGRHFRCVPVKEARVEAVLG